MSRYANILFLLLMLSAGTSMLLGLYTGLIRMGVLAPAAIDLNGLLHGPLMINGFLGTLIALERAAALRKAWTYSAPVCLALSTILLLTGQNISGSFFLISGSLLLVAMLVYLLYLQASPHHFIMFLGGCCLLTGNMLFIMNQPIHELVIWWVGFPVLTIFGERLELNRVMRPPKRAVHVFTVLIMIWIIMVGLLHVQRTLPWYGASLLLIITALWLIRYDVARKTIRSDEWIRYSALCMLLAYGWLIISGIYGLAAGLPVAGPSYDALLHMIFVGFVFSMIFAHAAIIIPSLTGKMVPYHPYFYMPLILLHISLLMRVTADIFSAPVIQSGASYGNLAAIVLFFGGIVTRLIQHGRLYRYAETSGAHR